jgi:hypothetical protein
MKTSRIMLTLALMLLCGGGAAGQETSFGFKVGPTRATISGDNTENLDTKTGMLIGAFASVPLGPSLAIAPELCYVKKGSRFSAGGYHVYINLDYVEIPVLLKYAFPTAPARPFLAFGPSLGIRTSATRSAFGENEDIGDSFASTDFGLVFGMGVNLTTFVIEGRYNLGLTNINTIEGDPDTIHNRGFAFLVGHGF